MAYINLRVKAPNLGMLLIWALCAGIQIKKKLTVAPRVEFSRF